MKNLLRNLLTVTAIAATLPTSHAAVISWGNATTIAGDSDVSTSGSLVSAFNVSGGNTTINGVNFIGANLQDSSTIDLNGLGQVTISPAGGGGGFGGWNDFTGFGSANGTFSGLSASYQSLLSTGIYPNGGNGVNIGITFTNLTIGYTYQVQLWLNDSRGGTNQPETIVNGPILNSNLSLAVGGVGQFATGTFTADDSNQYTQLSFGFNSVFLNATQLRVTAVPEPSTTALMVLGAVSIAALIRRRR